MDQEEMKLKPSQLFNSPLEIGLRLLILLDRFNESGLDHQKLVYFDYLMIHSGDFENSPESLHARLPYRSGEVLIKRDLILNSLNLMISRDLVLTKYTENGIIYICTSIGKEFLKYFESQYFLKLVERANWAFNYFKSYTDFDLKVLMQNQINLLGNEFEVIISEQSGDSL